MDNFKEAIILPAIYWDKDSFWLSADPDFCQTSVVQNKLEIFLGF